MFRRLDGYKLRKAAIARGSQAYPHVSPSVRFWLHRGRPVPSLLKPRYSQAVDILYSSKTFSIVRPQTVLSLSSLMLRRQFHAIRYLRFKWRFRDISRPLSWKAEHNWTRIWSVFATMKGLHYLRVNLAKTEPGQGFAPFDPEILEPLRAVTRPKKFGVRLPFPESHATVNTTGMPFCMGYCEESQCDQVQTGMTWGSCTMLY